MSDPSAEILSTTYKSDNVIVLIRVKINNIQGKTFTYEVVFHGSSFQNKEDFEKSAKIALANDLEILSTKLKMEASP
jgi:hypothetical protein